MTIAKLDIMTQAEPGGAQPEEKHPSMRVLLIEDDPVSLKILKKRVENEGYCVETAVDGEEGLAKYQQFKPQLIISDWMMPKMDGRELCRAIKGREDGSASYFILLTARDKHEDIVQALDTGADEYLIKPCNGPELMARLRAAQRMLELQHELALSNQQLQLANERINKELKDISDIQRSLLPQELPEVPGYQFAAHYQPSTECSGDFYDLLELPEGRIGIVMGDVSGHGAASMVAMALIRMLYRMEAEHAENPADFLRIINNRMFQHLPTDQYATMFYGTLDCQSGRLVYSSAGHPPAAICDRTSGDVTFLKGCEGFPIKLVDPDVDYENHETVLEPNHHMLFYTDGLPETFNDKAEPFGFEKIADVMRGAAQKLPMDILSDLLMSQQRHRGASTALDDLSMLIVGRD